MLEEIAIEGNDMKELVQIKKRKNRVVRSLNAVYKVAQDQERLSESEWLAKVLKNLLRSVEMGDEFED